MEKRYVQHISGQGEKWEVRSIYPTYYLVYAPSDNPMCYAYPKSEYVLCDPPEEWEDVTAQVDYCSGLAFAHRNGGKFGDEIVTDDKGYRFRKIDHLHNGPAFIIERKKVPQRP